MCLEVDVMAMTVVTAAAGGGIMSQKERATCWAKDFASALP